MKPGWRLAGVGLLFIGLFTVLGLRLWYLQVTSIDSALAVAQSQQLRVVEIEPPRGDILAAGGRDVMAGTVASLQLVVDPQLIPEERTEELHRNLAALLDWPVADVRHAFDDRPEGSRFTVGGQLSQETATFVLEHIENFPGVAVEPLPVRIYPLGESAQARAGRQLGAAGAVVLDLDLERAVGTRDADDRLPVDMDHRRLVFGHAGGWQQHREQQDGDGVSHASSREDRSVVRIFLQHPCRGQASCGPPARSKSVASP